MKKIVGSLVIFVLFFISNPAFSEILFYDDAEDYPSSAWVKRLYNNDFTVSSEQARAGSKSYKFGLYPYGTPDKDMHVELVLAQKGVTPAINNFEYNEEYWMGWSIYIPSDFVFPTYQGFGGLTGQWHNAPDACDSTWANPTGAFFFNSRAGGWKNVMIAEADKCSDKINDRYVDYHSPAFIKGGWNDIVVNFKFDYRVANKPFFKVWLNGVQYVNDSGINCWNDTRGPSFRMGIYARADVYTKVYYDEIRVGDAKSSYNEVAPKGSKSVTEPVPILGAPTLKIVPTN